MGSDDKEQLTLAEKMALESMKRGEAKIGDIFLVEKNTRGEEVITKFGTETGAEGKRVEQKS